MQNPLLGCSVAASYRPLGSEVRVAAGEPVRFEVQAGTNPDLGVHERVELIGGGNVREALRTTDGRERMNVGYQSTTERSGWYVARLYAPNLVSIHGGSGRPALCGRWLPRRTAPADWIERRPDVLAGGL